MYGYKSAIVVGVTAEGSMFEWMWAEWLWFPENLAVGWKDLENKPGTGIYYPQLSELHWSLLLGVIMLPIRYLLSR